MNKMIALLLFGTSLTAISFAEIPLADQQTATFSFKNVTPQYVETFSSNGACIKLAGLFSQTPLNENLAEVTLNATPTLLARSDGNGIGTGPFSDGELRNGAGTPFLAGATLVEIVNVATPCRTQLTHLGILLNSVDYGTQEGYLVYGSKQDALCGPAKLDLLAHGKGDTAGEAWIDICGSQLCQYKYFYVTADNSYYSSVNLGDGTKIWFEPSCK